MTVKTKTKPIFLLADSQVLFWHGKEGLFLERIKAALVEEKPERPLKGAYIGASNGDKPEFYGIFAEAMKQIQVADCRMIPSKPTDEDNRYLEAADLILLAGGNIQKGWKVIQKNGWQEKIVQRYYDGAVLVGVSAGAVQLGQKGWIETKRRTKSKAAGKPKKEPKPVFETFQLVPTVIDVHEEDTGWNRLSGLVEDGENYTKGVGIPAGGAAIFHPDWAFEAVRHQLTDFFQKDGELKQSLIMPPTPEAPPALGAGSESG